jgi:branched-chain amino acid transport system substrate-binding protein
MRVVLEQGYSLATTDFAPIMRAVEDAAPDLLFICSYLSDSIAIVRAIHNQTFRPKMVGGAMIGPQSTSVKTALGSLLNGFVNYDYWLPVPAMMFPGVEALMNTYQARAATSGVDLLGYYMAPQAYAQMQVIEQAITVAVSLDDLVLADYTRRATFKTVVGDVRFGERGEWMEPRVVQVQFQNVKGNGVSEFKDASTQVVVTPAEFSSGKLIYPYAKARAL